MVVLDVADDFIGRQSMYVNKKKLLECLNNVYRSTAVTELSIEEQYGILMLYSYLHAVNIEYEVCSIDDTEIADRLELSKSFKWEPMALTQAIKVSSELFEMAKEAYKESGWADQMMARIWVAEVKSAKEILEHIEYVYRDRDEVLEQYSELVSESLCDYEVITSGKTDRISNRLKQYIESLAESANEKARFWGCMNIG